MIREFALQTSARSQLVDITGIVEGFVRETDVKSGICVVYTPHTTAAVTINENADPTVKADIVQKLGELIPKEGGFKHTEGNSDSHIKSSLVGSSVTLIIENGALILGTWQGIFFCEFDGRRSRKYYVKIVGG